MLIQYFGVIMKKNYFLLLLFGIIAAVALNSCASTETTSFSDPDFRGKKYDNICVYAETSDLEWKDYIEKEMVNCLKDEGINAIQGSFLFPPTREWNDGQIEQTLRDKGLDGYILITIESQKVDEKYVPGEVVTEKKGETKKKKDSSEVYVETTTTKVKEGRVEKEYHTVFNTKLVDVASSRIAWTATSKSNSGEIFGKGFMPIFDSYASNITETLKEDGHIK